MACNRTNGITVFLDIQAAFDTANPSAILEHLVDLGIKGQLLEIIFQKGVQKYTIKAI